MGDKSDQVKGRVEEAAGALTGDKDLKRKGREDRLTGEAKEKVAHAKDKVGDLVDTAKDKIEDVTHAVKDGDR